MKFLHTERRQERSCNSRQGFLPSNRPNFANNGSSIFLHGGMISEYCDTAIVLTLLNVCICICTEVERVLQIKSIRVVSRF